MIRRFTIHGFKRFERETVVDLDDVTVLVGANDSGKSTVLLALTPVSVLRRNDPPDQRRRPRARTARAGPPDRESRRVRRPAGG